jgi:hypothetical protein
MMNARRILGPFEVVDYSGLIMKQYLNRPGAIKTLDRIPFVGYKILLKDFDAGKRRDSERIQYLEQYLVPRLAGTGCFLRETNNEIMNDGFWLVTMPVPIVQLTGQMNQLGRIMGVINMIETNFNMKRQGRIEINVSGRCAVTDTPQALSQIHVPRQYETMLIKPENSAYRIGNVVRINNEFMVLRTSWYVDTDFNDVIADVMLTWPQNISCIFG